jgi:hypothetical protein
MYALNHVIWSSDTSNAAASLCLSTSSSSCDTSNQMYLTTYFANPGSQDGDFYGTFVNTVDLTSKTTYYVLLRAWAQVGSITSLNTVNTTSYVKAVSAYLS